MSANLNLADTAPLLAALETMNEVAPVDWWRFVGCGYCNARRGEPCQAAFGPARRAHAPRCRAGLVLHGTLWLLTNGFAGDVTEARP